MSVINFPKLYENAPGSIAEAGKQIRALGKNALVIAGKTALEAVLEPLYAGFERNGVSHATEIFTGYPTIEAVRRYTAIAKERKADAVIGIGGGRALDTAKLTGVRAGVPFVTIPTIAATCAAWSPLAVLYTDDGVQDEYVPLPYSPALVVADKTVLKRAPVRYFHAGVADSLVKWYEIGSSFNRHRGDFALRLQLKICELILEFLEHDYIGAYGKDPLHVDGALIDNAIDSILMLTGMTGGINGNVQYGGLAHRFYHQFTKVPVSFRRLHGEIVVFGLMVQLVLEERGDDFVRDYLKKLKILDQPVTVSDLGLTLRQEEQIHAVANNLYALVPDYAGLNTQLSPAAIEAAVWHVDTLGKEIAKS